MEIIKLASVYAIPVMFFIIIFFGAARDIKIYEEFVEGAKEGITTVVKIIPALVGLMVAISVFRASGALEIIIFAVKPLTNALGIPSEVLPLMFMRPISGSASLALVADIIKNNGADSFAGRVASTMMGSTETIFYTLAVYFGAVGVKNIRYTLVAALFADMVSVLASVWVCTLFFGR